MARRSFPTLGSNMWVFVSVLSILGFTIGWLKTGSAHSALLLTGIVLPFLLVAGYFSTRIGPASSTERRLARAWIIFRRFVCFTTALVVGSIAAFGFVLAFKSRSPEMFGFAAFFGALALLAAWTGAYGAGNSGRTFSDDKPIHEERKTRYGWK
jgi:hypothetical protein